MALELCCKGMAHPEFRVFYDDIWRSSTSVRVLREYQETQEKDDIFLSAYEKENKAASDLSQNEIIIIPNASCTKVT